MIEQLAAAGAHPGKFLHYQPQQPCRDPLGEKRCAAVPTPVARTLHRFTLDSLRQIGRIALASEQLNGELINTSAEKLVESSDLRAVTLRLANIYGPRQRTDLEGGVIAIFIGCWKRSEPITMFGDGSYERDYVYIADVVESVLRALSGTHAGVYNIGTGVATSVKALVEALTSVLGPPPGIRVAPARPGEVLRGCVDPGKAAHEGLWRPKTALADGLRLTAASEGVLLS